MAAPIPKLELEYFNMKGRAEVTRACFWIGNIPFTDVRLSHEEFGKRKAAGKYPHGQVPVLTVDGVTIPQSNAMARYAGKLAGLYPADALQAFLVDSVIDDVNDVINEISQTFRMDPEARKAARIKAAEGSISKLGASLDKKLEHKGKFIVGDKLTIADLTLLIVVNDWVTAGTLDDIPATVFDKFPHFKQYIAGLKALPEIKAVYATSDAAKAAAEKA